MRLIRTVARRKSEKYPNINAFTTVVNKEAVAYEDFSRGHGYATHISSRLSEGICQTARYTIYPRQQRRRARLQNEQGGKICINVQRNDARARARE